jgi:hypothetical protein
LLGQVGPRIGIAKLLELDICLSELNLDEVEPDTWFLLFVWTKNDESGCRTKLTNLLGHGGRVDKGCQVQIVPGGVEELGCLCEIGRKK